MKKEKAKESGQKSFQCEHCKKMYWTDAELRSHSREFHPEGGPFTCQICQRSIKTTKTLRLHIEKHEEQKWKEDQVKKKESEEQEKFISKNEQNSCFQCYVTFKTEKLFKKHLLNTTQ